MTTNRERERDEPPLDREASPTFKRLIEEGKKKDPLLADRLRSLEDVCRRKKWIS